MTAVVHIGDIVGNIGVFAGKNAEITDVALPVLKHAGRMVREAREKNLQEVRLAEAQ